MKEQTWQEKFRLKLWNVYATIFQSSFYDDKQLKEKEDVMVKFLEEMIDQIRKKDFKETLKEHDKNLISEVKRAREETIREVKTCLPSPAFLNGLGKASYNEVETEAFENGVYQTYVRIKKYLDTLNKLKK